MKTLIAIPCMETVHTAFMQSVLQLKIPGDKHYGFATSSLIYDARNSLARMALDSEADYVLWLDSDMVFQPDLYEELLSVIDDNHPMVCGLYFSRKEPIIPVIYSSLEPRKTESGGFIPECVPYEDYPEEAVFNVAGCGFGAVLMKTQLIREIAETYGPPFFPTEGYGEDLTFCRYVGKLGYRIRCNSHAKAGHIANAIVNEAVYKSRRKEKDK